MVACDPGIIPPQPRQSYAAGDSLPPSATVLTGLLLLLKNWGWSSRVSPASPNHAGGFAKTRFADASAVRAIDRPPADDSLLDLDVREIGGRNAQRIAIK